MFRILKPLTKRPFQPLFARSIASQTQIPKTNSSNSILTDKFSRTHNYLRISLTERCNLRCTYCMPEDGVPLTENSKLLTTEEILKLAKLFVQSGVTKVRLTGGEPTLRKDLKVVIAGLNRLRPLGLEFIGMTSNGIALKRKLPELVDVGLDCLNLSWDSLKEGKYSRLTRRNGIKAVQDTFQVALESKLPQLKINCVVMQGVNEDEVLDFVQLTQNHKVDVRFIEYMPFDGNAWSNKKLVPFKKLLADIEAKFKVVKSWDGLNDTTKHYQVAGYLGRFGFISSMTDSFCSSCNRLRITADGNLKVCLFGNSEFSLRDMVRANLSEEDLLTNIQVAVSKKHKQHAGMDNLKSMKNRPMVLIGDLKVTGNYYCNHNPFNRSSSIPIHLLPTTSLPRGFTIRAYSTQPKSGSNLGSSSDHQLSHIDPKTGSAHMVDTTQKLVTNRFARAQAVIQLNLKAFDQIKDPNDPVSPASPPPATSNPKGDVLSVAQLAGIQAAKLTSQLIPLCHHLNLDQVTIRFELERLEEVGRVRVVAETKCTGRTGVEMEALTAATMAAVTVFDMCKKVDPNAIIGEVKVLQKEGGRLGVWTRLD